MIIAELHGKLDSSASSYEVSEDILTSNIFQLLRYIKPKDGLIPFINQIFINNNVSNSIDLSKAWKAEYVFWPKGIIRNREPDLLILLEDDSDSYVFVIEAKYYSGPSDGQAVEEETGLEYGNQLSDEFIDLIEGCYISNNNKIEIKAPHNNRYLIYLTKHTARPGEELNRSFSQFNKSKRNKSIMINEHVMWANWSKIWCILKKTNLTEHPFSLIIGDMIKLLEKKGFKEFTGFIVREWQREKCSFWITNWFRDSNLVIVPGIEKFFNK